MYLFKSIEVSNQQLILILQIPQSLASHMREQDHWMALDSSSIGQGPVWSSNFT